VPGSQYVAAEVVDCVPLDDVLDEYAGPATASR